MVSKVKVDKRRKTKGMDKRPEEIQRLFKRDDADIIIDIMLSVYNDLMNKHFDAPLFVKVARAYLYDGFEDDKSIKTSRKLLSLAEDVVFKNWEIVVRNILSCNYSIAVISDLIDRSVYQYNDLGQEVSNMDKYKRIVSTPELFYEYGEIDMDYDYQYCADGRLKSVLEKDLDRLLLIESFDFRFNTTASFIPEYIKPTIDAIYPDIKRTQDKWKV